MPDVDIQCLSCGNAITVSDVVDVDKLKCRACGGDFLRANGDAAPAGPSPEQKRRSLMKKIQVVAPKNPAAAKKEPEEGSHNLAW